MQDQAINDLQFQVNRAIQEIHVASSKIDSKVHEYRKYVETVTEGAFDSHVDVLKREFEQQMIDIDKFKAKFEGFKEWKRQVDSTLHQFINENDSKIDSFVKDFSKKSEVMIEIQGEINKAMEKCSSDYAYLKDRYEILFAHTTKTYNGLESDFEKLYKVVENVKQTVENQLKADAGKYELLLDNISTRLDDHLALQKQGLDGMKSQI